MLCLLVLYAGRLTPLLVLHSIGKGFHFLKIVDVFKITECFTLKLFQFYQSYTLTRRFHILLLSFLCMHVFIYSLIHGLNMSAICSVHDVKQRTRTNVFISSTINSCEIQGWSLTQYSLDFIVCETIQKLGMAESEGSKGTLEESL